MVTGLAAMAAETTEVARRVALTAAVLEAAEVDVAMEGVATAVAMAETVEAQMVMATEVAEMEAAVEALGTYGLRQRLCPLLSSRCLPGWSLLSC